MDATQQALEELVREQRETNDILRSIYTEVQEQTKEAQDQSRWLEEIHGVLEHVEEETGATAFNTLPWRIRIKVLVGMRRERKQEKESLLSHYPGV